MKAEQQLEYDSGGIPPVVPQFRRFRVANAADRGMTLPGARRVAQAAALNEIIPLRRLDRVTSSVLDL